MKSIYTSLFLLLLTGCIPKTHTISPTIEGVVLDAKSGQLLANVQVGSQLTNSKGQFLIERKTELGIATLMGGIWRVPTMIISITKEGYEPSSYACSILSTQKGCFNVLIELQKNNIKENE
jgi:hypothetical protein